MGPTPTESFSPSQEQDSPRSPANPDSAVTSLGTTADPEERARASGPAAPLPARYTFVSELARGGMGRVFVAMDNVLRREVAIKEVLSSASPRARLRFEREALLSARLQHPGIVSVHEFAVRPEGQAYLVMRRVHGRPLDKAIDEAKTLQARLLLLGSFIAIADAIAYAHDQGVVHRDLKPANAIVGEFGETVVIDWGLAKDLRANLSDAGLAEESDETSAALTRTGSVLGTPAYMSPEQARGVDATGKSDVYALGSILYQLLAGRRPYTAKSTEEVLRDVLAGPPTPLLQVAPEVAPELASIVERAMAREPELRFTAQELAQEVRAFQAGRLVQSHAYSTVELVARWVRKNALPVGLTAAFVVLLAVLGVVGVRRIVAERDRASHEAHTSKEARDFMVKLFEAADPHKSKGKVVTPRDLLDRGLQQIDALAKEPQVQAPLLGTLGEVYENIGVSAQAKPLLERSLKLYQDQDKADDPDAIYLLHALGDTALQMGHNQEAEDYARRAISAGTRVLGPENRATLKSRNLLCSVLQRRGAFKEARAARIELLEIQRRVLGPDDNDTLVSLSNLSSIHAALHEDAEAEKIDRQLLETRRRVLGNDDVVTMDSMCDLAADLRELGRYAESTALFKEALAGKTRVLGPDHPSTLWTIYSLGTLAKKQGHFAEAEQLYRQNLEARVRVLGPDHPDVMYQESNLAVVLGAEGKTAELGALAAELIPHVLARLGPKEGTTGFVMYNLGCAFALAGDKARAVERLRAAMDNGLDPQIMLGIGKDTDLASLRGDADFLALEAEVKRRAGQGKAGTE